MADFSRELWFASERSDEKQNIRMHQIRMRTFGCDLRTFGYEQRTMVSHPNSEIRIKWRWALREQPPRMCKNISSKINCESAIGQHLIANPECAKTYTDDNFRITGQARSSFHLSVLESVTQKPSLETKRVRFLPGTLQVK